MLFIFVDPTNTVVMCNVKQFLHKVAPAIMKSSGAVIPGTEEVRMRILYTHITFLCI